MYMNGWDLTFKLVGSSQIFYVPAIGRKLKRAYSVTPVHPSPSVLGVSNLRVSFFRGGGGIRVLWRHF